jgi:hypothetical protein
METVKAILAFAAHAAARKAPRKRIREDISRSLASALSCVKVA